MIQRNSRSIGFDIYHVLHYTVALMRFSTLSLFVAFLCNAFGFSVLAQETTAERPARFGVYEAVTIKRAVVHDVKTDKEGNVFLQLMSVHKDKELVVKISNEYFSSYRTWWHGEIELVSPANAGKQPYEWTDRVQTQANYIEYWMDGEVFLHLRRLDRDL